MVGHPGINALPIQPVDIRPPDRAPGVGTPIQRQVRGTIDRSTSPFLQVPPQQQQPNIAQLVGNAVGGGGAARGAQPRQRGGLQGLVGKIFPSGSLGSENPIAAALTVFKMVVDGAQGRGVDLRPLQLLAQKRTQRRAAAIEAFKLGQTVTSTILSQMDALDLPPDQRADHMREQGQIQQDKLKQAGVDVDITTVTNDLADRLAASNDPAELERVHQINAVAGNEGVRSAVFTACNGDPQCSLKLVTDKQFMDVMEEGIVNTNIDEALDTFQLLRDMTDTELAAVQLPEEVRAQVSDILSRDFTQAEFAAVVRGMGDMFTPDQMIALGSEFASDRLEDLGITTPRVDDAAPTTVRKKQVEANNLRKEAQRLRGVGDEEGAKDAEREANVLDASAAGFEAPANPTAQLSPVVKELLGITGDLTNEDADQQGINTNPDPVLAREIFKRNRASQRVAELSSTLIDQLSEEGVDSFRAAGGTISRVLTSLRDQAKGVFQLIAGSSGAAEDSEDDAYDGVWTRLDIAGQDNQLFRSRIFNLGFAIARSNDVGKLSDDDVIRALEEIGANGFGTAEGMIGALRDVARRTRETMDDDIGALYGQRPGQQQREPAPVRERAPPPGIQNLSPQQIEEQIQRLQNR